MSPDTVSANIIVVNSNNVTLEVFEMSDILSQLSQGLAEAVQSAGVSIVRVDARHRIPATGIIWSADGLVITAHHVIRQDENIQVGLPGGDSVAAQLLGRDATRDLALLRVGESDLVPPDLAEWDEAALPQSGHVVLALGRPGRTVQATLGIVSALGENWRTPAGGLISHYLQTDVVMYPGFSGGPLIDVSGRVLGMNSSALVRGVSLSVPVPTLRQVAADLQAHGHVRRGYLGISIQQVQLPVVLGEQLGQSTGLMVMAVHPDGPAEDAHLMLGDILVRFDEHPIRCLDDLMVALTGDRVGSTASLQLIRGGSLEYRQVVVGERE
jgi:S1-C subfamily serine protease